MPPGDKRRRDEGEDGKFKGIVVLGDWYYIDEETITKNAVWYDNKEYDLTATLVVTE